jgi:integrase
MPKENAGPRLERNDRNIYEIKWTENGRSKRCSTGQKDPAKAADAFRVWEQGIKREQAAAEVATVRGMLEAYWMEHVEPNCAAKDGSLKSSKNALLSHFADLHPAEITPRDVREYDRKRKAGEIGGRTRAGTKRGVQNPTVRRDLTMLVAALNHAVAEHRMKAGAVPAIALPPENVPRVRWLNNADLARLFTAAAEISAERGRVSRIELWLHLAYYTARRKAAIESLTWDRVDFEINTIDFDVPGRRRTKKRRGTAYMHPKLRACLERAHAERRAGDNGQALPWVLDHPGDIRAAFRILPRGPGSDLT